MTVTTHAPVPFASRGPGPQPFGPPALLGLSIVLATAAVAIGSRTLPEPWLLPLLPILLFVLAGGAALIAWARRDSHRRAGMSYWDAAGALTFIGILTAAAIEPDHLVALVEQTRHRP